MDFEGNNYYRDFRDLQNECKRCVSYHCILTMTDGSMIDGIVENVDTDGVSMLIGEDVVEGESENQTEEQRQYYGKGRPRRRFRRYRRRRFPFPGLAKIALLPYIAPAPYPYYPFF